MVSVAITDQSSTMAVSIVNAEYSGLQRVHSKLTPLVQQNKALLSAWQPQTTVVTARQSCMQKCCGCVCKYVRLTLSLTKIMSASAAENCADSIPGAPLISFANALLSILPQLLLLPPLALPLLLLLLLLPVIARISSPNTPPVLL
jgi:hypothetical protein